MWCKKVQRKGTTFSNLWIFMLCVRSTFNISATKLYPCFTNIFTLDGNHLCSGSQGECGVGGAHGLPGQLHHCHPPHPWEDSQWKWFHEVVQIWPVCYLFFSLLFCYTFFIFISTTFHGRTNMTSMFLYSTLFILFISCSMFHTYVHLRRVIS